MPLRATCTRLPITLLLGAAVAAGLARPARGGELDANPVAAAVRAVVAAGLQPGAPAGTTPIGFRRGPGRFLERFLPGVSDDAQERAAFKQALEQMFAGYDEQAGAGGYRDDLAGSLAFAVSILRVTQTGQELPDAAFPALVGQLRRALDVPAVRGATDAQRQELHEACLCYAGTVLTLCAAAGDRVDERIKTLAGAWLEELLGVPSARVELSAAGVRVAPSRAGGAPPAPAPAPTSATGDPTLARGFGYTLPSGWRRDGAWLVAREGEGAITSALVRFLPAVPARGNMGDALREVWQASAPPELRERASGIVYRRYVGDGLLAQFVFGTGREKGRQADTLCTLYLIDCGEQWQPVLFAQTYEDPTQSVLALVEHMGPFSWSTSSRLAAPLFESLRCPAAKGRPLADAGALAGHYYYGSASALQWEHIQTGATTMTTVSYGGELELRADGTFDYSFSGASGEVGRLQFSGDKATGRWRLEGDILVLDRDDEKSDHRYRLAGVTQFSDGVKLLILLHRLDVTVEATSVTNQGDVYSTRKR